MNELDLRNEVRKYFDGYMPSLTKLEHMSKTFNEIALDELRKDILKYVKSLKKRLKCNEYSSSIRAFRNSDKDEYLLVGYDDRMRKESNYAFIRGRDVYCWAGNVCLYDHNNELDGHLNEFMNNTDGYIPNSVYHLENVSYVIDSLGRVCFTCEEHVAERRTDRNEMHGELKFVAKRKGGQDGDVGGHIVAHSIDGPTEAINILPMDKTFNNSGKWKGMELLFKNEYQNHRSFIVRRRITYEGDSQRPIGIRVDAVIQNEYKTWLLNPYKYIYTD